MQSERGGQECERVGIGSRSTFPEATPFIHPSLNFRATVRIYAGVHRIRQDVVDRREGGLAPGNRPVMKVVMRDRNTLLREIRRHLPCGAEFIEFGEDQRDGLTDRLIRSKYDLAVAIVRVTDWRVRA